MNARVTTAEARTPQAAPTTAPAITRAPSIRLHRKCACGSGDAAGLSGSCESCSSKNLQRRSDGHSFDRRNPELSRPNALAARPPVGRRASQLHGKPLRAGVFRSARSRRPASRSVRTRCARPRLHGRARHRVRARPVPTRHGIRSASAGTRARAHLAATRFAEKRHIESGRSGPEYRQLEHEADSVASRVLAQPGGASLSPSSQLRLSRADDPAATGTAAASPTSAKANAKGGADSDDSKDDENELKYTSSTYNRTFSLTVDTLPVQVTGSDRRQEPRTVRDRHTDSAAAEGPYALAHCKKPYLPLKAKLNSSLKPDGQHRARSHRYAAPNTS